MYPQSTSNTNHPNQEETVMQCDKVWDLLSVYADGETSTHETTVVEAHIAQCADCARDLQFMQSTHAVLQDVPEVEPPAALRSAILAATVDRLSLTERLATAVRRTLAPTPVRYGAIAAAGAAALTAVVLNSGNNPVHYNPRTPQSIAAAPTMPNTAGGDPNAPTLDLLDVYQPDAAPAATPSLRVRLDSHRTTTRTASLRPGTSSAPIRTATRTSPRPSATTSPTTTSADDNDKTAPVSSEPTYSELPAIEPEPTRTIVAALGSGTDTPEAERTNTNDPASPRIVLTASAAAMDPEQIATLADLRRALSHRAADSSGNPTTANRGRDRQIRLNVIKGSF